VLYRVSETFPFFHAAPRATKSASQANQGQIAAAIMLADQCQLIALSYAVAHYSNHFESLTHIDNSLSFIVLGQEVVMVIVSA
jgi:hypothetical protein